MHQELSNTYGRKTIANELDNKPVRDFTLTEKDIRPMFVQVQVLERGQYFVSKMIMCLQDFPLVTLKSVYLAIESCENIACCIKKLTL